MISIDRADTVDSLSFGKLVTKVPVEVKHRQTHR